MIGAFTLAVIAAAFMFVFWFSGARTREGIKTYKIVFTSSVSGLSRGARVLFNGLNVGEVKAIDLEPKDPGKVLAVIEVARNTPVKTDTRARLESQGLTGVAHIALIGGTPGAKDMPGNVVNPPVITAEQSEIQNILESLQRLTLKVDSAMTQIEKLVSTNAESITNTIKNAEKFSVALGENSDGVKQFMASVSDLGKTLKPVAANLDTMTKNLNERIAAIEPEKLKTIIANAEKVSGTIVGSIEQFDKLVKENSPAISETVKNARAFSKTLADNGENVDKVIAALADVSKTVGPVVKNLETLTKNLNERIAAIESEKLKTIIANAEKISGTFVGSIEQFDKLVKENSPAISETVKNARAFSKTLADNGENVDKVIAALADVSKTVGPVVKSLETLTKNIDDRIKAIEPEKVKTIVANADKLTARIAGSVEKFDKFFDDNAKPLSETVKNVQSFSKTLADNREGVEKLIASLSDLGKTLEPAVKSVETIAADISKRVKAVDDEKLKTIVSNAEKLSGKLIGSADKLDSVLASLDKVLGSGDTKGVMADVSEAAKAIRVLAQNLDKRTKVMATGINRFTGAGLRQYEALAADGRRAGPAIEPDHPFVAEKSSAGHFRRASIDTRIWRAMRRSRVLNRDQKQCEINRVRLTPVWGRLRSRAGGWPLASCHAKLATSTGRSGTDRSGFGYWRVEPLHFSQKHPAAASWSGWPAAPCRPYCSQDAAAPALSPHLA